MGLFDDYIDQDQFQDGGGLLGRWFSLQPQLNASQSGAGSDPGNSSPGNSPPPTFADASNALAASPSPDIGARLGAGLQSWAQTPAGSPFAALANGISGFNNAANASFIGPPAPTPTQSPDLGDRLGAAFQSWAQTPVGSPFAALANGVTGFNTGQTSVASAASAPAQAQTPDNSGQANALVQNPPIAPVGNAALSVPARRLAVIRRWPQSTAT
jgi:hypothetical protein